MLLKIFSTILQYFFLTLCECSALNEAIWDLSIWYKKFYFDVKNLKKYLIFQTESQVRRFIETLTFLFNCTAIKLKIKAAHRAIIQFPMKLGIIKKHGFKNKFRILRMKSTIAAEVTDRIRWAVLKMKSCHRVAIRIWIAARIKLGIYREGARLYDCEKILCVSVASDSLFMARIGILTACIPRLRESSVAINITRRVA